MSLELNNIKLPIPKQYKLETKTVFVTPEMAKEWLESAFNAGITNRKLVKSRVNNYADDLLNDRWRLTHQGVAFCDDGYLGDGFHRLTAIVMTGKGAWMMITFGIARKDILEAVDKSIGRTFAQQLTMLGETNTSDKAAICRALGLLTNPDVTYGHTITQGAQEDLFQTYKDSINYVLSADSKRFPAHVRAPIVLLHNKDASIGVTFYDNLISGAGLSVGDPRLTLREKIPDIRKSSSRDRADLMMRTITAIDHFLQNKEMRKSTINRESYLRFCSKVGISVNKSLLDNFGRHQRVQADQSD